LKNRLKDKTVLKRNLFFFLILVISVDNVQATTWTTARNGYWNTGSTWLGGIAPAYTNSDTIYIKDTLYFNDNIMLNAGALMQVDSAGGFLCGHHNFTLKSGSRLSKYGCINADSLFCFDAQVYFKGGMYIGFYIRISGGAFQSIGSGIHIYFWEECFEPKPEEVIATSVSVNYDYNFFPNPNEGDFFLEYFQYENSVFSIYNSIGQIVFTGEVNGKEDIKHYQFPSLLPGVYIWTITNNNGVQKRSQFVIVR
jgi:hypothetical protein